MANPTDNLHLTACLLLYFQRRDEALGLGWQSQRVRGLLWYYRRLQQKAIDKLLTATELNEVVQTGAQEINRLVKLMKSESDKQALATQILELQTKVDGAAIKLKVMAQSSASHFESPDQFGSGYIQDQVDHNKSKLQRLIEWLLMRRLKISSLLRHRS